MKRLADILLIVAALLLLAACTDDADVYNTSAPSEGNLCVYIPVSRGADDAALGSLSQTVPAYNASVDECQINDLHLYAFPVKGNGTLLSQELPSPAAGSMIKEQVASYQLKIKPGKYRVYVVANMEDVLDVNSITTEGDLKKVVLSYQPMSKPGMPVAKNIPMIYEPDTKAADGTTVDGTITINNKTPKTVMANLRFTCVKVCLNLVYDPNAAGVSSALKNGMIINDVKAERLSPETKLWWDGNFSNPSVSSEYAKGIESPLYDATAHTGNGSYYTSWTETPANANVNNEDIITVEGEGVAKPADSKKKWLFRATYYLPERYVAKASQQSALKVDGAVGGSAIANSYNINLGHRKDETSTTEVPTFPRGTYYEIVGRIKSLGNIDLDCVVGVEKWQMATIDADFNHTTLWVSSTKAEVESQKVAFIDYLTNVTNGDIKFGCDTEIEKISAGKLPVIVATNDIATHRIRFSINPELSVKDFTEANALTGTAKVWIKAGNIKKYLDVSYDVTPYFKVDPVDIVIQYDAENSPELTKVVKFTTNLGGIQFPDGWTVSGGGHDVSYAQSTINIKCENTNKADGTFTIFAKTDPQTTTTHTFTVKSIGEDGTKKQIEQQIRVTVRPPVGPYRIYMRAINDLAWALNASTLEQFDHSEMLDEEAYNDSKENNNWRDGWWVQAGANWGTDRSSHVDYHKVYIYTQIGETKADGTKDENVAEWYFTGGWPGHSMKADNNNPGWYYYKIAHNAESEGNNNKGQAQTTAKKMIKPGHTLLIFSNGTYTDVGFQPHRFTHHNDPGITLFNYEDNEGWYLYDPTCDPYYRVYDVKPTVVDVEYTIYTKRHGISGWYVEYGVANGGGSTKFKMKSDTPNVENEFKCTECSMKDKDGNTWYKTILHLKAPLNEYAKILHVKINNTGREPELFDGDNYPVSRTVTRTINGRNCVRYVIEGSYDPDKDTWTQGAPF